MPETSVTAIVLRRGDSGESDRRLTLFTLELGKVDVIAKGARKSASRLSGVSEPLNAATFSLASGKRNAFITQAQPLGAFRGLRSDYERLSFALALVELYAAVLPYEEPSPEAFKLLFESLKALEVWAKPLVAFVWAEVALLSLSGVQPQFEECVVCGKRERVAEGWLSPQAGGRVCSDHAFEFSDRFLARGEVLIGLERIGALVSPPENLKFSDECFGALSPFWRSFADMKLPANEALIRLLHEERLRLGG